MRGYSCVGLEKPRFEVNIGCVLRAAHCYYSGFVAISGKSFSPVKTDTQKAYRHMPIIETNNLIDVLPYDCVPVAVEIRDDAKDLMTYKHPERAFYIFGPEGSSINEEIVSKCRDIIYIPTRFCMNLAATVYIVLYDRLLKGKRDD